MSAQIVTYGITVTERELIARLTGKMPKSYEMNFMGSGWCWFEDAEGRAYWLHVDSELLVESARNY